jgi:hypothetical protein
MPPPTSGCAAAAAARVPPAVAKPPVERPWGGRARPAVRRGPTVAGSPASRPGGRRAGSPGPARTRTANRRDTGNGAQPTHREPGKAGPDSASGTSSSFVTAPRDPDVMVRGSGRGERPPVTTGGSTSGTTPGPPRRGGDSAAQHREHRERVRERTAVLLDVRVADREGARPACSPRPDLRGLRLAGREVGDGPLACGRYVALAGAAGYGLAHRNVHEGGQHPPFTALQTWLVHFNHHRPTRATTSPDAPPTRSETVPPRHG